jgi:succinate dehydrogenase / fumarate reductase flavoprotein subunit
MATDKKLDSRAPTGPIEGRWTKFKSEMKLVNPANKRKHTVIVVGTGLAGGAASASLSEQGYKVKTFCISDSPRRAHSIAAQGGINAAKNYMNDGDSIYRLFYDTVKGGDYRSRESNVYRLAEVSVNIIDQSVAAGVPFAREYSGELANRSFGGTQVSRTFYARGQTGQQLLLGAYQALMKEVDKGGVELHTFREMLDLVVIDGKARGIIVRNLLTGEIERHVADAVVLATGGYGRVYFLSTNAFNCNVTATWRAHKRGAYFANPCFTQIHPTCIPVAGEHQSKLTLMSESLRNDGRVWVPKKKEDCGKHPDEIPEADRDYYLERRYPAFGNLVPRDVASRAAKAVCDEGRGVGESRLAVYLDFRDAIRRVGESTIREKYGNLFDMYREITDENPYQVPMRIYPAVHYTMGGLWVDYHLQSTIPGLFVLGEANFSDHGANRRGASARLPGLADGYIVIPFTMTNYLASTKMDAVQTSHAAFAEAEAATRSRIERILQLGQKGSARAQSGASVRTVMDIYRDLGSTMWEYVGMERSGPGLEAAIRKIQGLRQEFSSGFQLVAPEGGMGRNQLLEVALRVEDFLELGELMAIDALDRRESCGGHFRSESQEDGEAKRDDSGFSYVAAWEYTGDPSKPALHKEALEFEYVHPTTRSYK